MKRKTGTLLGSVTTCALLAASVTSSALAQQRTCSTGIRAMPPSGVTNDMWLNCDLLRDDLKRTAGLALARNQGGVKTISAYLSVSEVTGNMQTMGLNSAGQVVCTVTDSIVDSSAVSTNCSSAVSWRTTVTF